MHLVFKLEYLEFDEKAKQNESKQMNNISNNNKKYKNPTFLKLAYECIYFLIFLPKNFNGIGTWLILIHQR